MEKRDEVNGCGGSLNKEVEWIPWYSGTQGGKLK